MLLAACLMPGPPGDAAQLYGSCIQADSLANTPIGKSGLAVSCRFRARPGGALQAVRPYLIWSFTPILEVDYAGGLSQGMGYIEFWMGAPKPIAGPAAVRERFTVTGPGRRVASVAVRVRRLAGGAPLVATLEGGNGQVLATAKAEGPDLAPSPSGSLGGCGWVTFDLPGRPTLAPGRTYQLVFSCPGPGRFEAFPMRKGTDKGFSDATLFGDGHAEFTAGQGWAGWEQWGKRGLTNADLQFYFTCVPDPPMPDPSLAKRGK